MSTSKARARVLMYGNEAIGKGAYDAGVALASGYPGTPSTEIIEGMSKYEDIHVEWSTNEKVALEVAIGASLAGGRAIACMKHVGVNVASDPLMTVAYMGIRGGLVLVSADDPGMHSSQNEQDNRWFGKFAHIPVLEPADSQEAYSFTMQAFDISEEFDTPVMVRSTTRISHARSLVETVERRPPSLKPYSKDMAKYVMLPGNARRRKPMVIERLKRLREFASVSGINRMEMGDTAVGFVTGGIAYQYVKEAFPGASLLKLGMSYPMPDELLKEFASKVDVLYVVEELDAFWELHMKALGIECFGKEIFPEAGELSVRIVRENVLRHSNASPTVSSTTLVDPPGEPLPQRPPVLCPGCPHRGVFYVLKKLGLTVTGDIGCYTLGALPPLSSMDTCTCMGAGIGHAHGMRSVLPGDVGGKVVAVIGDSTFMHSGITPLLNMTYNNVDAPVIILDNGTTAMTGHQGHPGSGWNARHRESPKISIEEIAKACGRKNVITVNAYDLNAVEAAVRQALTEPSSVVVARTPCVLIVRRHGSIPKFDSNKCIECGLCLRPGCPALERDGKKPRVNPVLCVGCDVCTQLCPRGALISGKDGESR